MPKEIQNLITIELPVPVRQKPNGVYEARLRKYGLNVAVSSKDYGKLKPKFLAALTSCKLPTSQGEVTEPAEPAGAPLFETVALRWFELKRPTIKQNTITFYESLFRASLLPAFSGSCIDAIRQSDIQSLVNRYLEAGKLRTATKVFQTLKAVFDFAVGDDLIEKSPMRLLKPPKYEEKNGCALTRAEERKLIELIAASNCVPEVKHALLFLLYTGIRRSELASARIEGEFISVLCSKLRKGYQERRRLIPITPMLARWLPEMDLAALRAVNPDALTQAMKRLMPDHHLHELRHTFITRAQECSVPREVVSVWAGHAADNTQTSNVYTHFGEEFMLKEGRKVIYNL